MDRSNISGAAPKIFLQQIVDTKEYRLIPTSFLKQLRKDKNLSTDACWLWILLYEQAYFDEEWRVTVSRRSLAEELGKSKRSISALIKSLVSCGYLKQHCIEGEVPTYSVRFPKTVAEHIIRFEKDRKTATVAKKVSVESRPKCDLTKFTVPKGGTKSCKGGLQDFVPPLTKFCNPLYKEYNNIKYNYTNNNTNFSVPVKPKQESEQQYTPPVVVSDENKNTPVAEIQEAKATIHQLEQHIREKSLSLPALDSTKKRAVLNEIGKYTIRRDALSDRIESIKQQQQKAKVQQQRQLHWQSDGRTLANQPGERQLSEFQFHRLQRGLKALASNHATTSQLLNEVIFEIRFGSLRVCNQTQTPLPLERAINVGLKLVRERRWQSPAKMEKFMYACGGS